MPDDLATPDVTAMVAWLHEQVDEDERLSTSASPGPWYWVDPGGKVKSALVTSQGWQPGWVMVLPSASGDVYPLKSDADFIAEFDPVRALHEVEAKRRIIVEHTPPSPGGICQCFADWPCATLLSLLPIYADRPGFREEWRP